MAPDPAALGGATTRAMTNRNAFSLPAANLSRVGVLAFFAGNQLFNANFTIPGTGEGDTDGLGPTFNSASCASCHSRDGRGQPPTAPAAPMTSMLVRLSVPGAGPDGGPNPHPAYGRQLNILAVPGVPPEGRVTVDYREHEGRYGDGEPFSLREPAYELLDGAFGPFGEAVMISPRVAPQLIGLGLLEAVPEASLLARADPEDVNGDGVSGRPNMVWDTAAGVPRLGRFGWKANQPSLPSRWRRVPRRHGRHHAPLSGGGLPTATVGLRRRTFGRRARAWCRRPRYDGVLRPDTRRAGPA